MSDPQAALAASYPFDLLDDPSKQHPQQQQHQQLAQQQYLHTQQQSTGFGGLDFTSFHNPADLLAPHPDLFELELDSSLAQYNVDDLQLNIVDNNDAFNFLRSETPVQGPPSTVTASSDSHSAWESLSAYSDHYNNYANTSYSFPLDLEMDFQKFTVNNAQQQQHQQHQQQGYSSADSPDSNISSSSGLSQPQQPAMPSGHLASFGILPPTPPRSPAVARQYEQRARAAFSDYGAPTRPSGREYYSPYGHNPATVAPSSTSSHHLPSTGSASGLPYSSSRSARESSEESRDLDPKKKYKCPSCPRSFARAYNLKTHMATHDPNRNKPYICPHRSCARPFSRKHDLGRHLVSIHNDESITSASGSQHGGSNIGVESGKRSWCESCGKGYVGDERECNCDVK